MKKFPLLPEPVPLLAVPMIRLLSLRPVTLLDPVAALAGLGVVAVLRTAPPMSVVVLVVGL